MKVAASAFKAYDIRGIVGQALDEDFAEHLGKAFGSEARLCGQKAVVAGLRRAATRHQGVKPCLPLGILALA